MTSKIFEKKGVWHSELVRVTDPHGVEITFTGKPRKSQDSKSYYVYFRHGDEDHYLTIENDVIKQYLDLVPIDVPVTIHAFGSREAATVAVDIDGGAAVIDGVTQDGPPPLYPEDATTIIPDKPTTIEDTYLRCLIAAQGAQARFLKETGRPATDEDIRIATTILIQTHGRG